MTIAYKKERKAMPLLLMRDPLYCAFHACIPLTNRKLHSPWLLGATSVVGGTGAGAGAEFYGFAATAMYATATMLNTCE